MSHYRRKPSTASESEEALTDNCVECYSEFPADELEDGYCEDCQGRGNYPKYCCGMIYEEDEYTCSSCGETL